jgi:hypothetical protein
MIIQLKPPLTFQLNKGHPRIQPSSTASVKKRRCGGFWGTRNTVCCFVSGKCTDQMVSQTLNQKRTRIIIVVGVGLILLNLFVLWPYFSKEPGQDDVQGNDPGRERVQPTADELNAVSMSLLANATDNVETMVPLVGDLFPSEYSVGYLDSSAWQKKAVRKLNNLMVEAKRGSFVWDAEYVKAEYVKAGNNDLRMYIDSSRSRRSAARYHGQQLAHLGILTEAQREYVRYRFYSRQRVFRALSYDFFVKNHLSITKEQFLQLNSLRNRSKVFHGNLNLMTTDRVEGQANSEALVNISSDIDSDAAGLLTPEQNSTWSYLISEKPQPHVPPGIPEVNQHNLGVQVDLSLFPYLNKDNEVLLLKDSQKRDISDLEDVLRTAIAVTHLRIAENSDKRLRDNIVADLLVHAQELALTGVLSQQQEHKARQDLGIPANTDAITVPAFPI